MSIKVSLFGQRVLVEDTTVTNDDLTAGGIYAPGYNKESFRRGLVVEVGNDKELQEVLKRDDIVMLPPCGGIGVVLDGKEYSIFNFYELMGKLEV